MTIERIRYLGVTYYFNPTKPDFYMYDKEDITHVIIYTVRDYCGVEYQAEWRIPGREDSGILFAKRMALKLSPWKVVRTDPAPFVFWSHPATNY